MYLEKQDIRKVQPIISATFPNYTGTKVEVRPAHEAPQELRSYWDGGSRNSYAFYNLDTRQTLSVHSNHPSFEPTHPSQLAELPAHVVLVEHIIFCGKDLGLRLYGHLAHLLPAPSAEVSQEEKIVLTATRSLKNSYGGKTGIRKHEAMRETGITAEAYDTAYQSCIAAGYLNTAGAITVKGKNIADRLRLESLRMPGYKGRFGI